MQNNRGVTLTELAIVITIVGLLLAATMGGLSIRKASETHAFIADIATFQNAIEGFSAKYNELPGDMSDAWNYWGGGGSAVCGDASHCNGNNDGNIVINASDGTISEVYRAWQHLTLSEFLDGSYSGVAPTSNIQADIGVNIPAAKRTGVGYSIGYNNTGGSGYRNEILLGGSYAGHVNTNQALSPQEALVIDNKLDDGVPGTGKVHGVDGSTVAAGSCVTSGAYNVSYSTVACTMTFSIKP